MTHFVDPFQSNFRPDMGWRPHWASELIALGGHLTRGVHSCLFISETCNTINYGAFLDSLGGEGLLWWCYHTFLADRFSKNAEVQRLGKWLILSLRDQRCLPCCFDIHMKPLREITRDLGWVAVHTLTTLSSSSHYHLRPRGQLTS